MTVGQVNIWRMDVLKATVACLNDKLPVTIVRFVPLSLGV